MEKKTKRLGAVRRMLAIGAMMAVLRLCAKRDDALSLRICIPLTLAILAAMESLSPAGVEPHREGLRQALGRMRAKLSRLEGTDDALA